MIKRRYNLDYLFFILLSLQLAFWFNTKSMRPDMSIVPEVPGEVAVKANSLGDEQFYFRILGFEIQNAGDLFGRFSALKSYDYEKLYAWFKLLDSLDSNSNYIASTAGYYFSQTQYTPDVLYVVKYLDEHASRDLEKKWWWMAQAVYLANHKLKDKDYALELAYKLSMAPGDIPMWARQMPAFIHEQRGEKEQAYIIIKDLLDNYKNLKQEELNFMHYFIKDRLEMLKESR